MKTINEFKKTVFVYGSLKKGFGNNRVLGDSELLGESFIGFDKLDGGGFPYVHINEKSENNILVEKYLVTSPEIYRDLDRLEGHPTFYKRISVKTVDGTEGEVYHYMGQIQDKKENWKVSEHFYNWK